MATINATVTVDEQVISATVNSGEGGGGTGGGGTIGSITGLQAALDGKAPSVHGHIVGDVAGLQAALDGKAPLSHTQAIATITGLQAALDALTTALASKADASHSQAIATITGLQAALDTLTTSLASKADSSALANKADVGHTHAIAAVVGLQSALDTLTTALGGKADVSHTQAISTVTGLQGALDSKAASAHGHAIADVSGLQTILTGIAADITALQGATGGPITISSVTGLQAALDGKADTSHTQAISTVTGLQTALDGKAESAHGHVIADVTGLQPALDGKADTAHTHGGLMPAGGEIGQQIVKSGSGDFATAFAWPLYQNLYTQPPADIVVPSGAAATKIAETPLRNYLPGDLVSFLAACQRQGGQTHTFQLRIGTTGTTADTVMYTDSFSSPLFAYWQLQILFAAGQATVNWSNRFTQNTVSLLAPSSVSLASMSVILSWWVTTGASTTCTSKSVYLDLRRAA